MTRAALLVALALVAGCAHYWVRDEALARLDAVDPEDLAHVAIPALRVEDERPVHVRGVYVRPEENNGARRGWRRVEAHTGGLSAGIALLSIGGALAIPGAIVAGVCATGCSQGTPAGFIGGVSVVALGGVGLLLGTIFTVASVTGRPQELVRERNMKILDGPGAQPLAAPTDNKTVD